MQRQSIQFIISVCGWLYFVIWSLSFYPQVFTLISQKSAKGMNSNYIFINLTGYAMYTVYNLYGYFKGDNPETGKVDTSDLFFSLHSVFVYSLTVAFYFYYPHNIQINPLTKLYLAIQWFVLIYFGFSVFSANKSLKLSILGINTPLKYFQTLGYFKMFSTLLKHPPQIYHNFKRKSTKGWSITGMIMDFFGGFFSLIALLLELSINPEFHVNHAKLFLSIVSMIYDVTYMIQHYGLYGQRDFEAVESQKQRNIQSQTQQQKQQILQKKKEAIHVF